MQHIKDRLKLGAVLAALVLLLSVIVSLLGCSKTNSDKTLLFNKVVGVKWKCYEYHQNNVADLFVVGQQPTFEFRSDNRLYFSQINPVAKDTFQFELLDDQNIKVTKPWASSTSILNFKIDNLDTTHFDFTITTNYDSDVDNYKTLKQ